MYLNLLLIVVALIFGSTLVAKLRLGFINSILIFALILGTALYFTVGLPTI